MEYQELDALVSELESAVEETTPQKGYWKELWDLVRRIGAAFKEARYPDKSQKDEAWRLFQSLVERAKARSVREKERIRERERGFEERKRLSQEARSSIESMAASATPSSEFERGLLAIITFPVTLALDFVETTLGVKWGSELDERQDELRLVAELRSGSEQAFDRIRNVIAPTHFRIRSGELGGRKRKTPCVATGVCGDCRSPERGCNIYTIIEGRPAGTDLHVIIVNQDLGLGWDPSWPEERIAKIRAEYKKFVWLPV